MRIILKSPGDIQKELLDLASALSAAIACRLCSYTPDLKRIILAKVSRAYQHTSVLFLFASLLGFAPASTGKLPPDYIAPSDDALTDFLLEHDSTVYINIASFLPPALLTLGREYISSRFDIIDNPADTLIRTKAEIERLSQLLAMGLNSECVLEEADLQTINRAKSLLTMAKKFEKCEA